MADEGKTIRIVSVRVTVDGPRRKLDLADGTHHDFDSEKAMNAWLDGHYGEGNWMADADPD
jgi:hypothetical protein